MAAMSSQPSLFGDEPAHPTDRLFFGVFPPKPIRERIVELGEALKAREGLRGKVHQENRVHVTLFHFGDYVGLPNAIVEKAKAAAAALRFAPFETTFDRAESFSSQPRNRPFTLRGETGAVQLIAMRQALATEMMKVGLAREARTGFTPHVTLLYDDKAVDAVAVEPVSWTVKDFVLVHSHLGQSRHDHLHSWPLKA